MPTQAKRKTQPHGGAIISLADRSPEERREIASKGGKASAKARKRKKIILEHYRTIDAEFYRYMND